MPNTSKTKENTSTKVYVGMSGGVDSSVSALLLKKAGYDVTGVFIKVWQPDNTDCGWKDERRDAMRVAAKLDIPFLTFDFSDQYKKEVVDYMISEYKAGRTPNPDVMCNRHVKFGSFLKEALKNKIDFVATGHYAQIEDGKLKEGIDMNKDQSYFLWTLTKEDLSHVLFPIGHLEKSEVRKIAEKNDLPVFDKKDSQGVCFIGHLDMKEFLKEHIETKKGDVIDIEGKIIGEHDGAVLYTVGERHGFTVFNTDTVSGRHFVVSKDIQKNTLTVADEEAFKEKLEEYAPKEARLSNTMWNEVPKDGKKYGVRIRYRQEKQHCVINGERIIFDKPQKGMAEGQSAVVYDGEICIGGGILEKTQ